jgi:hypothetical protein
MDIRKGDASSMMSISNEIPRKVQQFASENASTLLTAGGVVGTVATAVLSVRAGVKAERIIAEREIVNSIHNSHREMVDDGEPSMRDVKLSKTEKFMLVWPQFIPPVATGTLTITAIIFANRMSAQKAAALAAAYGLSKKELEEYKTKIEEKLTGPKNQAIKDEIAQDKVNENPPSKQVVILAGGDMLCYDAISGRYFRSSVERIKRAEAELNNELFDSQMASVSEFYEKIGLPRTTMSDMLGWSAYDDGTVEFEITTTLTDDKQPCIVITPSRLPEANYTRRFE